MLPLDTVLAKLSDARRDGAGFKACCPAHDDRNPSLAISEADDGRVLLKCWVGCTTESIVAAMGLKTRDLFPESDRRCPASEHKPTKPPKPTFPTAEAALADYERHLGQRSATWEYHDRAGNLVGVVSRWNKADGKKDIRPVSLTCMGWKQEGMRTPRPLYRLPEVIEATGPIFVCEGEKCADALRSIGLVGTTSPHGAQSASKADWSVLAGKTQVIIVPDNDSSGEKYASDVIAQLWKLTPRPAIKLLHLPGLPEGGDIADWLEDRDAIEPDELRQTIEALADAEGLATGDTSPKTSGNAGVLSPSSVSRQEIFRPFPVDVLPRLLGDVVRQVSTAMGCDPSFVAVPALAVLAGAIGNSRRIRLKHGWTEPAIVWTSIVGESGTLKSPPLEWLTQPLRDREESALEQHAAAMEEYERELIRYAAAVADWKKRKSTEPPPLSPATPTAERRLTSDTTIEAICLMLADNPRGMILVRDELAGWVSAFDQYKSRSGSDAAHWLAIHSAKGFAVDRKTGDRRTLLVSRPAMSVTGGIQPATLRSVLSTGHIESGLAARLLFTYPPRKAKRWTEADISPELESRFKALVDGLFSLKPQIAEDGKQKPLILDLTPAGKSDWINFYNDHAVEQSDLSGELAAAWSKLECYAARLALVVHCIRVVTSDPSLASPDLIDESSIGAGVVLSRWFGHEARRVYAMLAETEDDREQRRLVEWITTRGGTATARELQRGPRRFQNATAAFAEAELNKLVGAGLGRWEPIETTPAGGQPSRRFRLNELTTDDTTPENTEKVKVVSSVVTAAEPKEVCEWSA